MDGVVQVGDREESPMPKRGQYPTLDDKNGIFNLGFIEKRALQTVAMVERRFLRSHTLFIR